MSYKTTRIGFIGGGHMARAMVRGLLAAGHPADRIAVADPSPEARSQLNILDRKVAVSDQNDAVANTAGALVLAVKPQVLPEISRSLQRPPGQLALSIAAGIPLERLAEWLGAGTPIVRAMPNQPAQVGAGVTALVATHGVNDNHRRLASYICNAAGATVWLPTESLMDAVTAISGSGPAYFYLLMELMEQTAVKLGLPPELAATLVRQTALGAGRTATECGTPPAALRASVTSPGGTTAAALAVFDAANLQRIVDDALTAARDRGVDLGKASKR
jgi:pyrroline-5-carboxylate reductase